jgi:hypothetical protein
LNLRPVTTKNRNPPEARIVQAGISKSLRRAGIARRHRLKLEIIMNRLDQLAELLFIEFQQEIPLTDDKGSGRTIKNLSKKNIEQRLDRFYKEAREARKQHHLWVIGWARVVLKLQQRLLLAGYPPEVVSKLLLAMIFASYKSTQ